MKLGSIRVRIAEAVRRRREGDKNRTIQNSQYNKKYQSEATFKSMKLYSFYTELEVIQAKAVRITICIIIRTIAMSFSLSTRPVLHVQHSLRCFMLPFLSRWNFVGTAKVKPNGSSHGLNLARQCYHASDGSLCKRV
jgi:hypothetical protein